MELLSNDHPRIEECSKRMGVDLVGTDAASYRVRSANFKDAPEEWEPAHGTERPVNFFVPGTEKRMLKIAVALENVQRAMQISTKPRVEKVVAKALENTTTPVPILRCGEHVYWGTPVKFEREGKMVFELVACSAEGEEAEADCCPAPPKVRRVARAHEVVTYNNVRYDDADEARHAVFLTVLGIPFKHQPCSVPLPLLDTVYRTDFYVPSLNAYLETTETTPAARKLYNCEQLALHAAREGRAVYLLHGGLHPPCRRTYDDPRECLQITKYVVEEHVFANGARVPVATPDAGYCWVRKGDGAYAIEKIGPTQCREWDCSHLRDAYRMAAEYAF